MFAVVRSGGKQYRVAPGNVFKVEKLENDPSSVVSLSDVLLVSSDDGNVVIGSPTVDSASVSAEVVRHVRNKKIIVFKKKRRHNYRRKNGHRQWMTVLRVTGISLGKGE
jgi:large subunit ribosomal protein L21